MIYKKIIQSSCTLLLLIVNMMASSQIFALNNQQLAAYEGNPEAQFKLALSYSQGETKGEKNYSLAAYWYTQAARQGMPSAQYNLGHFYLQGVGVQQNTAKTIEWWKQAAHQNYLPAQHNIGTAYFEGIGVEKNSQLAVQWFKRCAELGSEVCVRSLATVTENLKETTSIASEPTAAKPIQATETTEQIEPLKKAAVSKTQNISANDSITDPSIHTTNADNANDNANANLVDSSTTGIVEELSISVHIQAKPNSTIIAQLTSSNDYTVIADNNANDSSWQQIQLNKPIAVWLYKEYVAINEQTGKLIGDKVRARTEPSVKTGKVITELAKGIELDVLQEKNNWVQLALTNHVAWMSVAKQTPIIAKDDSNTTNEAVAIESIKESARETKTIATKKLVTNNDATIIAPEKLTFKYTFLDRRSDDAWLFKSDPKQFSILMGSFDNSKKLAQFTTQIDKPKNDKAHILLAKRHNIEWKYVLYGNFNDKEAATQVIKNNNFNNAYVERIGNIQEHRCSAWKTTIPSPKKLSIYCLKKTAFNY